MIEKKTIIERKKEKKRSDNAQLAVTISNHDCLRMVIQHLKCHLSSVKGDPQKHTHTLIQAICPPF